MKMSCENVVSCSTQTEEKHSNKKIIICKKVKKSGNKYKQIKMNNLKKVKMSQDRNCLEKSGVGFLDSV